MIKIGDIVMCIKPHSRNCVTKGYTYTVLEIHTCSVCGVISYLLDHYTVKPNPYTQCKCGKMEHISGLMASTLFRPIDYPKLSYSDIAKQNVEERLDVPVKHSVPAKQH